MANWLQKGAGDTCRMQKCLTCITPFLCIHQFHSNLLYISEQSADTNCIGEGIEEQSQSQSIRCKMGWRGILGFEYGIVQAPLGPDISGPHLVAAVANAGGLGLLRAPDWVHTYIACVLQYVYISIHFV